MIYKVLIETNEDAVLLEKIFSAERFEKEERSNFKVARDGQKLKFTIEANDPAALRAILNSITKLFDVYEKMKNLADAGTAGNKK